jgi:hypothetical protein
MKNLFAIIAIATLSGCAYTMQLMPRDSGKIYQGQIKSNGAGSGTLSIGLDGKTCSGTFVTVASGDTFGFAQTFGSRGAAASTIATSSGSAQYKALLTCSDGSGLRCDVTGSTSGGGVCVDSNNRVYDMMYSG